ncbi:ATP exporter [Heterobasidion irregulare TC 32-1]|uniref:GPI ethanolamine phosphate transferase 1 n=1 Tax=Heterobasidion irregulare (strain TC 32-1) TaxID=747525 RepID=W4JX82_HETIT|nr:ATP exporter [Heterobasidion irregulare TC 32-1]ETW77491.1 ATP exporter [Heterobasidion irregulare TC 32-1]
MSNRSGYSLARILTLGLIFHLVYIGTVFDCYFTSPVVHGMRPHRLPQAEAKRLVLIVGDGLRADFVFSANASAIVPDAPERVAPYLREIVETRGAYGISHTRVPTESRPGHVAIIGGMYEDVSAVTKGWKTNPVNFDSVFNQSSHTFSFGSPDILPMFSHGATPGKVKMWCYDEEDEDFTKDATALDIWVFEHLEALLSNATTNESLNAQLRQEKVVFFLHLLGLDTTGHSYRPHSKEYMNNIRVVDDIVRKTEQLISRFYGDEDTSFVFTADHGMSRIGNHGDGDPDNTRTPLIAWGAGIRGPIHASTQVDEYSAPWELGHLARRDVEQADIAALMSALLGIDWPVNSVGVLPDVDPGADGYLKMKDGEAGVAAAALTNAKVILEHYRVKHEMKEAHTLFYKPFRYFEHPSSNYPGSSEIADIERLIAEGRFSESRRHSAKLITAALQGLRYLETYDRTLIRIIVTVAYTGWIAFSALFILVPRKPSALWTPGSPLIFLLSVSTLLAFWALFALQKSAWTLYIYIVFPVYFWHRIIEQTGELISFWRRLEHTTPLAGSKLAIGGVLVVAALQSMVLGYTHRAIWSVGFVLIGIVWPAISWPKNMVSQNWRLYLSWASACVVTAIFPLLRVDPAESTGVIMLGGLCMLLAGLIGARRTHSNMHSEQLVLILASMSVTASSIRNLQAKTGLPLMNQVLGWVVLVTASLLPAFMRILSTSGETKFLIYVLTFCPCFIILSIRAEGLFYLSYCVTLFFWIKVEEAVRARTTQANGATGVKDKADNSTVDDQVRGHWNPSEYRLDDVRIALFFLFFVQVGFFGTGNVASISSFYLEPVYRLVPIFSPFLMASLLLFKILAPYVLLSVAFATVNARVGMPPFALFLVALTLTDGMTMTFFFNVTDSGSWLQIGQSISHFCITSLLLVFSAVIAAAGEHLLRDGNMRSGGKAE